MGALTLVFLSRLIFIFPHRKREVVRPASLCPSSIPFAAIKDGELTCVFTSPARSSEMILDGADFCLDACCAVELGELELGGWDSGRRRLESVLLFTLTSTPVLACAATEIPSIRRRG